MPVNVSKLLLMDWDVKWGDYNFGGVDKVTPEINLTLKEKKVGTMGNVELGHWIVGLAGKIQVEAREIDHTFFEQVIPWNGASATASIPLFPASLGADLYDYAKTLILHPSHLATNVTNLDITFKKAVPMLFPRADADGENPNKAIVDFVFYPDRASFPTLVYGWLGPAA